MLWSRWCLLLWFYLIRKKNKASRDQIHRTFVWNSEKLYPPTPGYHFALGFNMWNQPIRTAHSQWKEKNVSFTSYIGIIQLESPLLCFTVLSPQIFPSNSPESFWGCNIPPGPNFLTTLGFSFSFTYCLFLDMK